jgi:hypothetical protein
MLKNATKKRVSRGGTKWCVWLVVGASLMSRYRNKTSRRQLHGTFIVRDWTTLYWRTLDGITSSNDLLEISNFYINIV